MMKKRRLLPNKPEKKGYFRAKHENDNTPYRAQVLAPGDVKRVGG